MSESIYGFNASLITSAIDDLDATGDAHELMDKLSAQIDGVELEFENEIEAEMRLERANVLVSAINNEIESGDYPNNVKFEAVVFYHEMRSAIENAIGGLKQRDLDLFKHFADEIVGAMDPNIGLVCDLNGLSDDLMKKPGINTQSPARLRF